MPKVGEKINLKKEEFEAKQEAKKKNEFLDFSNELVDTIKSSKDWSFKLTWCENLLSVLENWYLEHDLEACRYSKAKVLPLLEQIIEKTDVEYMPDFFELYRRLYAFTARRDFECFVEYMEWDMPKKVYVSRKNVLASYVDALNRCAFEPKLEYIVASFPPSIGKSYCLNLFTAWSYGLSINHSNIRMSYSEELVRGFSRTVKNYLLDYKFCEVFTNFQLYKGKPFKVEKETDWTLKNANVPKSNLISRSRGGTINGERTNFAFMFDDMTKGQEEANNVAVHQDIYDRWNTDWYPRRTDDPVTYIFVGTQWSNEDILNRIIEDREAVSPLKPSEKYKYTWESEDGSTIVIKVPMLDSDGVTTCPIVYPQEKADQIKRTTDEFLFSCVYQQDPIAPTGREFSDELLEHFKQLPVDEDGTPAYSNGSYAVLDPARRGKDNVAMPICKHGDDDYYYLIDCLFEQKPMSELYDTIVDKIIDNNVIELVIENNTDTSLKALLEDKLKAQNYFLCEIKEKYNTVVKEQRIRDNRGVVKRRIKFKEKTMYFPNTSYGRFMKNLNYYSFDYPNKHDDAPDSICMLASEIIIGGHLNNKIEGIDRKKLGF